VTSSTIAAVKRARDVQRSSGRLRRLVVALLLNGAVAALAAGPAVLSAQPVSAYSAIPTTQCPSTESIDTC
jgi:hypothetical protein